ncbi:MAG: oligopeptide/dipeptide ABC transporter ATP-binding protein, partial [Candidatus Poribacteria bacterium]|nr:oligopeptide/dipeptide ABC transporter ATP-binding protein [Candidatus Poribacteria bacterium]
PKHPYTEALISAVPMPDPEIQKGRKRIRLEGDVPDPSNPPLGCHFHPRCGYAVDVCAQEELRLKPTTSESGVACHRHDELSLQGI